MPGVKAFILFALSGCLPVFGAPIPDQSFSEHRYTILLKHCQEKDPQACLSLGYIYLRGIERERDFSQAKNYFEKACDSFTDLNQKSIQCESLAQIFENGREARVDKKIAMVFHEKSKEAARAMNEQNQGVFPNEAELKLCDSGDGSKCLHVAEGFLGPGHLDLKLAEDYFDKACENSKKGSKEEFPGKMCEQVAEFYENGRHMPQDLDKAGVIYKKACERAQEAPLKNGFSCDLAGAFYRDKKHNKHMAARFFRSACEMGFKTSCDHLSQLALD
jgi:TPR repeat protein